MNYNEMTIEQLETMYKETGCNTVIKDGVCRAGYEKRRVAPVQHPQPFTVERIIQAAAALEKPQLMELLRNIPWRERAESVLIELENYETQVKRIDSIIGAKIC